MVDVVAFEIRPTEVTADGRWARGTRANWWEHQGPSYGIKRVVSHGPRKGEEIDFLMTLPPNGNPGPGGTKVGFRRNEWLPADCDGVGDWTLRVVTKEEADAYVKSVTDLRDRTGMFAR